jgi:RNA polymerase sigma factor (sigma-70 family)
MVWDKGKEIIKAIKTGDNTFVLNHLYKEILPRIRKMILKNSGTEDDAKDIFQDTVLIFYNQVKLNKYYEDKDIGGFMYTVARNLWINKAKRANKFVQVNDTEIWEGSSEADALDDLISKEKESAIEQVMSKIGEECKKLLKYSIYEKLSLKEIASKMGYSSEGVAKTYNYRCKQKLVNLVKDNPNIISLFKE